MDRSNLGEQHVSWYVGEQHVNWLQRRNGGIEVHLYPLRCTIPRFLFGAGPRKLLEKVHVAWEGHCEVFERTNLGHAGSQSCVAHEEQAAAATMAGKQAATTATVAHKE